jgi:hypothetical protein
MTIVRNLFLIALAFAAVPAQAAPRGYYPAPQPYYEAAPQNALRLQIGGASLSSPAGVLCDQFFCSAVSDQWSALMLGGDLDLALGRGFLNLTVGARELIASHASGYPNILEPSVGATFKFMRGAPVQPRLGVGVGLLFDNNGDSGASLRLGGGVTFLANGPVGLALDVTLDVGRLSGYDVTQVQFAIGPEFHF